MIWFTVMFSGSCFAGGMTSSGGYFTGSGRNPWFLGDQPIRWCVEHSTNFSLDEKSSVEIIEQTLFEWQRVVSDLELPELPFMLSDQVQHKRIGTNFVYQDQCNLKVGLRFVLGDAPDYVNLALGIRLPHTVSAAVRVVYWDNSGRANGAIWFAPDMGEARYQGPSRPRFWQRKELFKIAVAHELGHVFGLQHEQASRDALMNEDLVPRLVQSFSGEIPKVSDIRVRRWADLPEFNICGRPTISESLLSALKISKSQLSACFRKTQVGNQAVKEILLLKNGQTLFRSKVQFDRMVRDFNQDPLIAGWFLRIADGRSVPTTFSFLGRENIKASGTLSDLRLLGATVVLFFTGGNSFDFNIVFGKTVGSIQFTGSMEPSR